MPATAVSDLQWNVHKTSCRHIVARMLIGDLAIMGVVVGTANTAMLQNRTHMVQVPLRTGVGRKASFPRTQMTGYIQDKYKQGKTRRPAEPEAPEPYIAVFSDT